MYTSLAQQVVYTSKLEESWIVRAKHNDLTSVVKLKDNSFVLVDGFLDVDERGKTKIFKDYYLISAAKFDSFEEVDDYADVDDEEKAYYDYFEKLDFQRRLEDDYADVDAEDDYDDVDAEDDFLEWNQLHRLEEYDEF